MPFARLEVSLSNGFLRDHCALCRASLDSVLREVPCPHWFVTPGPRGFRIERLIPVFEVFDMDAVISFLRILAATGRPREHALAYRAWQDGAIKCTAINWRNRGWLFEQDTQEADASGAVEQIVLSTFLDGELMEKAKVELDQRERRVVVTTFVSRRREPSAAMARAPVAVPA